MSTKKFEFSAQESLVSEANDIFEKLGLNLDTALHIFFNQVVQKKGLPFPVTLSVCDEKPSEPVLDQEPVSEQSSVPVQAVISEPQESCEKTDVSESSDVSEQNPDRAEIDRRVAENEALVAELKLSCNDDESEKTPISEPVVASATATSVSSEPQLERQDAEQSSLSVTETEQGEEQAHEEDEDETCPTHMFDSWDTGTEEEIGCNG